MYNTSDLCHKVEEFFALNTEVKRLTMRLDGLKQDFKKIAEGRDTAFNGLEHTVLVVSKTRTYWDSDLLKIGLGENAIKYEKLVVYQEVSCR